MLGYPVRPYDSSEIERLHAAGLTAETDPTVVIDPVGSGHTIRFTVGTERKLTYVTAECLGLCALEDDRGTGRAGPDVKVVLPTGIPLGWIAEHAPGAEGATLSGNA